MTYARGGCLIHVILNISSNKIFDHYSLYDKEILTFY